MLGFPAFGFGMALVEAEDFSGEKGGFVTASASADFDECVAVFVGIGREEGVLDVFAVFYQCGFEFGDFHFGHFGHFWVIGACEFLVLGELGLGGGQGVPELESLLEFAVFAEDTACAFRIAEEIWVRDGFFEFTEAVFAFGDEL